MDESLLRQRRNLFISGLIIFIAFRGNISIQELSLGNAKFDIENNSVIYEALWVAFFYFFVRYIQYFLEYGLHDTKETLLKSLDKYCSKAIYAELQRIGGASRIGTKEDYSSISNLHWSFPFKITHISQGYLMSPANAHEIVKEIKLAKLLLPGFSGFIYWIFKTPYFTDFILPFLFVTAVAIGPGFSEWHGSLISVING